MQEIAPDVVVLFEDNFNFLSKMCLSRMREAALTMAAAAKAQGAMVIAAGSDVSDQPEAYLPAGVDVAVFGEGDHTVMRAREVDRRRRDRPGRRPGVATACGGRGSSRRSTASCTAHLGERTSAIPTCSRSRRAT